MIQVPEVIASLEVIGVNEVMDDTFCDSFLFCFNVRNYCR